MIDRTAVNRALAKAIAFKQCGKDDEANDWARQLVEMLGCAGILAAPSLSGLVEQAKQAAKQRAMTLNTARHLLNRAEYDARIAEIKAQHAKDGGFWEPIAGRWLEVKPPAPSPEPETLLDWLERGE